MRSEGNNSCFVIRFVPGSRSGTQEYDTMMSLDIVLLQLRCGQVNQKSAGSDVSQ